MGIGAGAHGKISFRDRIMRTERERKPQTYLASALAGDATQHKRDVAEDELPFEFMLNALRLVEGFPLALFNDRTGLPVAAIEPQLAKAESMGLIARDHLRAGPTRKGERFLNDLLEMFLPSQRPRRATIPISISSPGTHRP